MNIILKSFVYSTIVFLIALIYLYLNIFIPKNAINYPVTVEIVEGENLSSISNKLYSQKIINNKFIFENFVKITRQDSKIKTGEYTYHKPLNNIEILSKIVSARYEYIPVILTIKEGEDSRSITENIYSKFKKINQNYTKEDLLKVLESKEGYLFPETYNFAPFATLNDIYKKIDTEFLKRIEKYNIPESDLNNILIIASILEKEVPNPEDMKIVSGIIQNRLKKNMPLQMDSTLGYITGKGSLELTTEDLRSTSTYNTYKVKGLPAGPIGNPGDFAIEAALYPDENDYIYFLSDSTGKNHYAVTYAEHLKNRKVYLGK